MIALDTNILVYAHREDSPHHTAASEALHRLARGGATWALPWPCAREFLAVVTHPRIYAPPTAMPVALAANRAVTSLPNVRMLYESPAHLEELEEMLSPGAFAGPRVHDARIAVLCVSHGVSELWTADRDFSWLPALRTHNPLRG